MAPVILHVEVAQLAIPLIRYDAKRTHTATTPFTILGKST